MTWMRVEEMEKKMQKCAEDPKERMTTPQADGFFMPGEYEPHDGCILIWPSRPGSWIYGARDARIAFRDVIAAMRRVKTYMWQPGGMPLTPRERC